MWRANKVVKIEKNIFIIREWLNDYPLQATKHIITEAANSHVYILTNMSAEWDHHGRTVVIG